MTAQNDNALADHPGLSKIPSLDALRGLACSMVLLAHLNRIPALAGIPSVMAAAGVGLFFVLSGFLITRILLQRKRSGGSLHGFYSRRAARILPVYFLVLAVVGFVRPGPELLWALFFIFNLYYVTDRQEYFLIDAAGPARPPIIHFWSLCVEEHFYWLWPLCIRRWKRRGLTFLLLGLALASPAITWVTIHHLLARDFAMESVSGLIWRLTPTSMTALCLGSLFALHEDRLFHTRTVAGRRITLLPWMSLALLLAFFALWQASHCRVLPTHVQLALQPALLHLGCTSLFGLALASGWLGRIAVLRSVGRLSYGLYMYHLPIYAAFGLASTSHPATWINGALAVGLTFAAAALSYTLFESRILAWERSRGEEGWRISWRGRRFAPASLLTALLAAGCLVGLAHWFWLYRPIPEPLRRSVVEVPGAAFAYRWMDVLHVQDGQGFRRLAPPGPPIAGRPRLAVIGDSVVFGHGVEAEQALANQLQAYLEQQAGPNETLNMGKNGVQAEDLPALLSDHVLPLQPRAIIYLANPTDLLPANESWEGHTINEVLRDPRHQRRWLQAMRLTWQLCQQRQIDFWIVPIVSKPRDRHQRQFARILETWMREQQLPFISVELFLSAPGPRSYAISHWENHPNPEWHRRYGALIGARLVQQGWPPPSTPR